MSKISSNDSQEIEYDLRLKQLECDKREAEIKKLRVETVEAGRTWFKRPTFWIAVFPAVLGALALLFEVYNGSITARLDAAEFKETQLKAEEASLQEQAILIEDKKQSTTNLENQLKKRQQELDKVQNQIDEKTQQLAIREAQLQEQESEIESRIEEVVRFNEISDFMVRLRAVQKKGEELWPLNDSLGDLVSELEQDSDGRKMAELDKAIATAPGPVLQGHLLAVKYIVSRDQAAWDGIELLARKYAAEVESPRPDRSYWRLFGIGKLPWNDEDNIRILSLLSNIAADFKPTLDAMVQILSAASVRSDQFENAKELVQKIPVSVVLIDQARSVLLSDAPWYQRVDAARFLGRTTPRLFVAICSELITRGNEDNKLLVGYIMPALRSEGSISVKQDVLSDLGVDAALTTFNNPQAPQAQEAWQQWRATHPKLVEAVSDPDLADSLKRNPAWLEATND